jgi:hypothetical protein
MKRKKRPKKSPEEARWEAESEARLQRLRELEAKGWAELEQRRAVDPNAR